MAVRRVFLGRLSSASVLAERREHRSATQMVPALRSASAARRLMWFRSLTCRSLMKVWRMVSASRSVRTRSAALTDVGGDAVYVRAPLPCASVVFASLSAFLSVKARNAGPMDAPVVAGLVRRTRPAVHQGNAWKYRPTAETERAMVTSPARTAQRTAVSAAATVSAMKTRKKPAPPALPTAAVPPDSNVPRASA